MKVLITGATGLVGKKLTDMLVNNGISVNYLTSSTTKKIPETDKVKGFYWNLETNKIDKKCLDDVDAIIHLAGATVSKRWTTKYQAEILNSRVDGIKLLFKALSKNSLHNVKHFISASGISIYPNSLTKQFNEFSTSVHDNFLAEVVEKWESAADQMQMLNIKVSKVRTGLVLDNKNGAFPIMLKAAQNHLATAFGSGKQVYSWIHIDDLVNMYYYILTHNLVGVYNAVASNPETCNNFMKKLAKALNTTTFFPNVPGIFLNLALGQMSTLLLDGQYVLNGKIVSSGFTFKYDKLEEAFADLIKKRAIN